MVETKQIPSGLLFFAFTYPPSNEIGSSRTHRFARYLPEFGFDPYVLASGEATPDGVEPRAWTFPRRVERWELPIRRFFLPGEDGLSWIARAESEALRVASHRSFSAILSSGPPVAPHLAAGRVARRLGLPWLADFRDPVAGSPVRTGFWMRPFDHYCERWIVRRAAGVVLCTNVMLDQVKRRYPHAAGRFHLLWNGFDPSNMFRPPCPEPAARRVLLHLGSLYDARNPNLLLRGADLLLTTGRLSASRLEIRLIGGLDSGFEPQCPEVWSRLREAGVLYVDPLHRPKDVVRRELAASDGLLLVDMNPRGIGYALPAKVFEYVPAGRPMLAMTSPGSPSEWVLRQCGVPTIFLDSSGTPEQAADAILAWLDLPPGPHEASSWFWSTFDGRRQAGELAGILGSLIGARQAGAQVQGVAT